MPENPHFCPIQHGPVRGRHKKISSQVALGSGDGSVCVWNLDDHNGSLASTKHGSCSALAFSPDGTRLACGGVTGIIRISHPDHQDDPLELNQRGWINSLAWSPDGTRLACGSSDGSIRICHLDQPGDPLMLNGHEDQVESVAWSPDGAYLASGSRDRTVRVWDVTGRCKSVLVGHLSWVDTIAWAPSGGYIASGSHDGTVRIWKPDGQSAHLVLIDQGEACLAMYMTPKDAERAGNLPEWSMLPGDRIRSLVWDPDGSHLSSSNEHGTVRTWRLDTQDDRVAFIQQENSHPTSERIVHHDARHLSVIRGRRNERSIVDIRHQNPVAWIAQQADLIIPHPTKPTWALVRGSQVMVFKLERASWRTATFSTIFLSLFTGGMALVATGLDVQFSVKKHSTRSTISSLTSPSRPSRFSGCTL